MAAVFAATGVAGLALDGVDPAAAAAILGYGLLTPLVIHRRPSWRPALEPLALVLVAALAWAAPAVRWWLVAPMAVAVLAGLMAERYRADRRTRLLEAETGDLVQQLDRRMNELFSLQELSYVLSESLRLDRIAEQVARYAQRFLGTEGAVVVLTAEDGKAMEVAAAEGSLAPLLGQRLKEDEQTLVMRAVGRERLESAGGDGTGIPVALLGTTQVTSAAAAPLRAHGVTMGAVAVADRRGGAFTPEDLWLLSTVATHAAVVLANGRFFDMIRRGKEEWETAFDALAEGIAVVNPEGRVARANRALARLLDLPVPAIIGRPFAQLVIGRADEPAELIAVARRGERPPPLVLRSDALQRMLRLTAAPLAEANESTAVVVLIEDVTEQRAMEAQLIQSEKLAAVGQLVSGVAHELNNPLTSIAGLSEFLLEQSKAPESDREHLRVIHDQAERAGRIVRNLLTFARPGVREKTRVDMNDVAGRTALLIAYEMKLRGIELERRMSPTPVTVRGDRYELQQVLLNLLTNAVQSVSEIAEDRPRRILLETAREGDSILVRVRDNGAGIKPEMVNQIFTPFFTTKEPGEGTGLGLSISYGIIEAHGGRLAYAPASGSGAEFLITLPLDSASEEPVPAPIPSPAEPRWAVLLVDDDARVQRTVATLFKREGHTVVTAPNGTHGLELALSEAYDLIIADSRAVTGSGRPFVEELIKARPECRDRLVVAGGEVENETERALRRLGYRLVRKPLDVRALRSVAAEVLGAPL